MQTIGTIEIRIQKNILEQIPIKSINTAGKSLFSLPDWSEFARSTGLFVLSFEDNIVKKGHKEYFLPKVEIIEYNFMADSHNIFDQPVKNDSGNIYENTAGQEDYYTTGCFVDYAYFKENYNMIVIDISKPQTLEADPKAIQQINFTGNLDLAGNTTMSSL